MTDQDPTFFRTDVGSGSNPSTTQDAANQPPSVQTQVQAQLQAQQPAPDDYYQRTFAEIVAFVLSAYQDIAASAVVETLRAFLHADCSPQRLFARLLTRKGPVFFVKALQYREVTDSAQALLALEDAGLVTLNPQVPADLLLAGLTKARLLQIFPRLLDTLAKAKQQRKTTLIDCVLGQYDEHRIRQIIAAHEPWCSVTHNDHWDLAQMLYYGRSGQDWSAHVMRDLGHTRYEQVELSQTRFTSAKSLRIYLQERLLGQRLYRLAEYPQLHPGLVAALSMPQDEAVSARLRKRSQLRLAKWCEQHSHWEDALQLYRSANIPPARERRVRILHKLDRQTESETLREAIIAQPMSATESIFAQRFNRRGQGAQPKTSQWQIQETPERVEHFVLEQLLEVQGGWGIHSENALIKSLTGLIYWQAIFAPVPGAFTNPFQVGPHDLYEHDFVLQRQTLVAHIEAEIETDRALRTHILNMHARKTGITNPMVSWGLFSEMGIEQWLDAIPAAWIRQLTGFLLRNLNDYRRGFPDLFLSYADGTAEFVEVKGPTDQLQPQQRAWFQVFEQLGIPARVIKLKV